MTLPHQLERTVTIAAPRETVFRFFTDSARWAAWWGSGSTIDARPGGKMLIRYPNGVEASGEVLDLLPPDRIAFTFGYANGQPIPPGSSRVTISLEEDAGATRVHVRHEFADEQARDLHVQGWRFQLSLFANVVANEHNAGAADAVDTWFTLWSVADETARATTLGRIASPTVRVRDQYSLLTGFEDLIPHITASQRFMPGLCMKRRGNIRHCQGVVLTDWVAVETEGKERASGTNVFLFNGAGQIEQVTGFLSPA